MAGLVWDDSRIDELSALVNRTVIDYLEQFDVAVNAGKVAHECEVAAKESLVNGLVDWHEDIECGSCGADLGPSARYPWHYAHEDCRALREPIKEVTSK